MVEVSFGEGSELRSIGGSAFWHSGIREIVLPEGVESIGGSAFMGAISLERVVTGARPPMLPRTAFFGLDKSRIELVKPEGSGTAHINAGWGEWILRWREIGYNVEIYGSRYELSGGVILPDMLGGGHVSTIASFAFEGMSEITSVEIQRSVHIIGSRAFGGNTRVMNVTIPSTAMRSSSQHKSGGGMM